MRPLTLPASAPMSNQPTTTNPFAIASLVLGLLACLTACFCCYGFPFNVLGGVLGIVAVVQNNADRTQGGSGLAYGGIGLSLFSVVLAVGMVIFGVGLVALSENM